MNHLTRQAQKAGPTSRRTLESGVYNSLGDFSSWTDWTNIVRQTGGMYKDPPCACIKKAQCTKQVTGFASGSLSH
ncbi:hypothetical protein EMPS_09911 [Entomortierella parvispora]|uniref:Uncharacterized protein n=1 Tax=Entomortierella parvispora TaxID=205924 RepID=A0A9P3HJR4_9FUNG|nr:hypothetical protein EMPS_09911 [Entomortierella parvispora]